MPLRTTEHTNPVRCTAFCPNNTRQHSIKEEEVNV
jgi:hypothetical protein